jgi:hypothetical protein
MADSPVPSPRPPGTQLDRASLERVLARAAELQSSSGDTPEEISEEQLLELGREVGLSPQNLRQALAEERTRSVVVDEEKGFRAGLFGPSRIRAARSVSGKPSDVLATIDVWMQRQELLIVKRHHADRIVWEPRRDFLVGIKRAFKAGGRDYALSRAFEVSATVMAIDENRVHVGLDGDFRNVLSVATGQSVGGGLVGAATAGALTLMGVAAVIAIAPVIVLTGAGVAAGRALQHRVVTRAQLALEQLLDRLERGELARRGGADAILGAIVAAATSIPPRRL